MAPKKVHTAAQITAFLEELEKQTDRGAALVAAAVLDEILEILITERLIEVSQVRHDALFGRGKPLDLFSAKIELGFQLGLYPNAARIQFEMIREVRNKFAHRIEPLKFDDPKIKEEITSRRTPHSPKNKPPREEFWQMFAALASILYSTMAADEGVRIQSLAKTHAAHFQKVMQHVLDRALAGVANQSTSPQRSPGSGGSAKR